MSSNVVMPVDNKVIDVGGRIPSIFDVYFLAISGSSSCTGWLYDGDGRGICDFTVTIPQANGSNDPVTPASFTFGNSYVLADVKHAKALHINVGSNAIAYVSCSNAASLAMFKANGARGIQVSASVNGYAIGRIGVL